MNSINADASVMQSANPNVNVSANPNTANVNANVITVCAANGSKNN